MKVQYSEGKYKGMTASGKNYDTAVNNLKNKIINKEKREVLYSLTNREIECLYKLFDCQVASACPNEFAEEVQFEGNCWELTEWNEVEDLSRKLLKLTRLVK